MGIIDAIFGDPKPPCKYVEKKSTYCEGGCCGHGESTYMDGATRYKCCRCGRTWDGEAPDRRSGSRDMSFD